MLKRVATFTLNRLFILLGVWLVLNAYARSSCGPGASIVERFEQTLPGLAAITRALQ